MSIALPSSPAAARRQRVRRIGDRARDLAQIAAVGLTCTLASAIASAQGAAPAPTPAASQPAAQQPAAAQPAAAQPATPQPATAPPSASQPATPGAAPARADDTGEERPLEFVLEELRRGSTPMNSDEAAKRAVKTAPSMAKARAATDQARAGASQALVAVYPRVDLIGQYTRLSAPPDVVFEIPGATDPMTMMPVRIEVPKPLEDQYLLQARLQYPVSDLFFQVLPRYDAAKQTTQAQALTARSQSFTVALQGRESFYNYARARATLLVARSAVAQREAQLKDVDALVRAGTVARVEQMRADADLAAARVAVARAQGAVAIARTGLRTLLHLEGNDDIALSEDLSQVPPQLAENEQALLASALQNRSELRALKTLSEAQQNNEDADNAAKLPKLSIGGTAELGNPNQRATSSERKWTGTWAVMGTLSWSPNDFASGGARAGQTEAQRAQTFADMAALEDALRTEVARAYEEHQSARQAMDAAQSGIRAAGETYRVRREQFRAGAAVQTDVVIAENDLNRARLELINAVIDLRIALARLERAIERDPAGAS